MGEWYISIISMKYPSFFMTTFSAILTNLTALVPQSHDSSHYLSRAILALNRPECRNTLIYAHATSPNLPTCVISLLSLTLPAPKAGDFVELILLYTRSFLKCVI